MNTQTPPRRRTAADNVLALAVGGLTARPKTLPCKLLYDARGSELFELICDLPEY